MLLEALRAQPWFLYLAVVLFGLCVGSFLNVVIYRLPKMMEAQWRAECASLAGEEQILLALGFFDLVVQIAQRVLELLRLEAVLLPRLLELLSMREVLALAHERLFGEIVAPFLDREHRLLLPVLRLAEFRVRLIAKTFLVGDRRRDLLLCLGELAAHVDQNLRQHLLGVFGPRDQVIDVRPQQGRESVEYAHGINVPRGTSRAHEDATRART